VNAEGKAAPHRVHKAKVILEALQGAETVNELTFEHDLNPNLVKNWVSKATFEIARVFTASEDERGFSEPHCKIGERDYLQRRVLKRYGIDIKDIPGRFKKR
jgi:hypothetical protein